MKKFEEAIVELITFATEDVITTSPVKDDEPALPEEEL